MLDFSSALLFRFSLHQRTTTLPVRIYCVVACDVASFSCLDCVFLEGSYHLLSLVCIFAPSTGRVRISVCQSE